MISAEDNTEEISKMTFSAIQIQQMLPHKFPFLLIDEAYDVIPGISGCGKKYYTLNEWFFQGHFPGEPIVPGVLLIESLAQLTAIIYLSEALKEIKSLNQNNIDLNNLSSRVGYLVKSNVKFMSPVRPGTVLEMSAKIIRKMGNLSMVSVKGKNGRTVVVEGELSVSEKEGF
ncbi:3-hydroxyacyl-ACP dehydratase FabZ family protein [Gracilinema caldarium]|uniref:3-hydroxyacyl-ACP dehydratase FabZ family protein n=1 Tax=Gracilinema caldarium TaxID=215591 RepID=UPI0026F0BA49|nr:3-hydroxyacyl-ACP dehydratase FabZ family protein [Gracilinema caldarium]